MNPLLIIPASLVFSSLLLTGTAAPLTPVAEEKVAFVMMKPGEKFLEEAAEDQLSAIKIGEMAKDKASNAQVKDFAGRLVSESNQTLSDIRALASKKDVTLPTDLEKRAAKKAEKLFDKSGDKFDKAFIKYVIEDHRKDRRQGNELQEDMKDSEIKELSKKIEAMYNQQLDAAKKIRKSLKE